MKLSSIPVVKLPLVDVSTDPLDLLVAGLALRMKQLARTSPKFIELVHERQFRIQIGTDLGVARQIIVNNGQIDTVAGDAEKADFIFSHIFMKKLRNPSQLFQRYINPDTSIVIAVMIRPIGFAAIAAFKPCCAIFITVVPAAAAVSASVFNFVAAV